jgi:hypothetical protein
MTAREPFLVATMAGAEAAGGIEGQHDHAVATASMVKVSVCIQSGRKRSQYQRKRRIERIGVPQGAGDLRLLSGGLVILDGHSLDVAAQFAGFDQDLGAGHWDPMRRVRDCIDRGIAS